MQRHLREIESAIHRGTAILLISPPHCLASPGGMPIHCRATLQKYCIGHTTRHIRLGVRAGGSGTSPSLCHVAEPEHAPSPSASQSQSPGPSASAVPSASPSPSPSQASPSLFGLIVSPFCPFIPETRAPLLNMIVHQVSPPLAGWVGSMRAGLTHSGRLSHITAHQMT